MRFPAVTGSWRHVVRALAVTEEGGLFDLDLAVRADRRPACSSAGLLLGRLYYGVARRAGRRSSRPGLLDGFSYVAFGFRIVLFCLAVRLRRALGAWRRALDARRRALGARRRALEAFPG